MPTVYVEDKHHGIVMIKTVGGQYGIFPLKEVIIPRTRAPPKYIFEKYTCNMWGYKPYEDDDVMSSPRTMLDWVKRWTPHKVRQK